MKSYTPNENLNSDEVEASTDSVDALWGSRHAGAGLENLRLRDYGSGFLACLGRYVVCVEMSAG